MTGIMICIGETVTRLIYMMLFLLGSIPPVIFIRLSNTIGSLWFAFDRRHRTVAMDNMKLAYNGELSHREVKELVKENFIQLTHLMFEIGWSMHLKKHDIKKYVSVEGLEHLNNAFSDKKGVLLLTGHLGSWELLTLVPALVNPSFTFHDIYRPLDFKPLEDVVTHFRTRFGMKLIPKDNSMLRIFRALKRGEAVGIPLDQSVVNPHNSIYARFFGRRTSTNKGLSQIALRTGSPVVPVFMVRENGKYKVIFGKGMTMHSTGNSDADELVNTERFNGVIEHYVRRYPTQWFWVHNRWKRSLEEPEV